MKNPFEYGGDVEGGTSGLAPRLTPISPRLLFALHQYVVWKISAPGAPGMRSEVAQWGTHGIK